MDELVESAGLRIVGSLQLGCHRGPCCCRGMPWIARMMSLLLGTLTDSTARGSVFLKFREKHAARELYKKNMQSCSTVQIVHLPDRLTLYSTGYFRDPTAACP